MALPVHYRFIGSTGLLKPYQCQNDIWFTDGNPNLPVAGDARLVVQGINLYIGAVYYEIWDPIVNDWEVWTMPPGIIAQREHTPNPNAHLIGRVIIPNHGIANQRRFHPIIWGYRLPWNTSFFLRNIGAPIFYIPHAPRRPQDRYLLPLPGVQQGNSVLKLKWGSQVNEYRGAWSVN